MRLCVFIEPQLGATYEHQLAIAQRAEALGFEGFFRSDHYIGIGGGGCPGPTDSWVTLGGARARDGHDPARHAGDVGDVPAARARSRSRSRRSTR